MPASVAGQIECLEFQASSNNQSLVIDPSVIGFDQVMVCGLINSYTWTASSSVYWRIIFEDADDTGSYSRIDDDLITVVNAPSGTTISDGQVRNDDLLRSGALSSNFEFGVRVRLTKPRFRFLMARNGSAGIIVKSGLVMGLDPVHSRN